MWKLRIEQHFQVQDYALWEVIENENSFKPVARTIANIDGTSTSTIPGPVTTEEKANKKNDVKARSMLLMALPNEHLLIFSQYKDAKSLFAAIHVRFGGNDVIKKTQNTLLKQMYENFNALSTESFDSIFNRLQKIVSQLAILSENISPEDLNLKFLRSLPAKWNTDVVVWRNNQILTQRALMISTTILKFTNDVNTANVQVSTTSTPVSMASSNENTANLSDATIYAFLANQPNGSQLVHEDLNQIHEDDLEEMDLKWQLALLSMRARRFYQRTGKKITINGSDTTGYEKSKVECFNCHKMGHFARECRSPRNQDNRPRNQDSSRKNVNVEETSSKAMVAIDGAGFDWSFMSDEEVPTNWSLMAFSNLRDTSFKDSKINALNIQIEKLKKEKEINQIKIDNFENASKSLDKLIGSQISDNSRKAVLTKSGLVPISVARQTSSKAATPVSAARPIITAIPKPFVNAAKPRPNAFQKHMTGNKSYLTDYQDYDGGFVTFAGSSKGGRITGKGKIRTGKLDFEDVYFLKELKFNLFSVSQMCDRKNSVLFTETKCLILSLDFKLPDESQVLLKVPRKELLCTVFDLKMLLLSPIKKGLTCLFAKATNNESKMWHRRLGHINFKTMNKLMKGNLIRGLPSMIFENDHTCVACQKGKQHKATFNTVDVTHVGLHHITNGHQFTMSNRQERIGYSRANVNTVKQIHVIVDDKAVVISESSVRSDLLFDDEDAPEGEGSAIPPEPQPTPSTSQPTILEPQTASILPETPPTAHPKQKHSNTQRTKKDTKLPQTSVPQDLRADEAVHKERCDSVERAITTDVFLDAAQNKGHTSGSGEGSMEHTFELTDNVPPTPHDSPPTGGYTPGSDEVIIEDKGSGEKDGSTADQFSTARPDVSAATPTTTIIFDDDEDLTIAQTLVKMKSEKAKEKGVVLKDVEDNSRPVKSITTLQPLPTIDPKDKGKGILVEEPEKSEKVKRRDKGLAQIESDAKLAQRLYEEELAEVEKRQKERAKQEEASIAALYDDKQKSSKNPKVIKEQESTKSDKEAAKYYEQEKEELRMWLIVVPDEEETMDPEILSTKYPIVDWESQNLGREIHVYKIIRADGNTSYHKTFFCMLRKFDRQDLVDLHRLVMKRFEDNAPEGYNLFLWGDLKIMFEPNVKDEVWSN
ncbi:putative ribonuclease H-like domain-containing protein [Tanacetum coccineum]